MRGGEKGEDKVEGGKETKVELCAHRSTPTEIWTQHSACCVVNVIAVLLYKYFHASCMVIFAHFTCMR